MTTDNMEKEKIEQLNKEIIDSQDRLGKIMTAINQERLTLEDFQKQSKQDFEKITNLKKELENIEKEKEIEKQNLINLKERNEEKENILNSVISKRQVELNNLESNLKVQLENYDLTMDSRIKELNDLKERQSCEEKKHKEIVDGLKNEILNLSGKKDELIKNNSSIELSISLVEKKLNSINEDLKLKKDELEKSTIQTLEIVKKNELVNNERLEIISKIEEAEEKFRNLVSSIKPIQDERDSLDIEIKNMKLEISQFIKDKITLQKDKEDLRNKEEFINEKYQQAGIKY